MVKDSLEFINLLYTGEESAFSKVLLQILFY